MKLEVNKKYNLKYSGEFCHCTHDDGVGSFKESNPFIFVGEIIFDGLTKRNIFYSLSNSKNYVMFGTNNVEEYATSAETLELTIEEIAEKFGKNPDQIKIIDRK